MGKFIKTAYTTPKEILKFPEHHESVTVTVSDVGIASNSEGNKIVPGGTIVGGGFLSNRKTKAVPSTAEIPAEGVLRYDVDVSYGPAVGAAVIHGFVNLEKIPTAPTTEQIAALKQITFLK